MGIYAFFMHSFEISKLIMLSAYKIYNMSKMINIGNMFYYLII